MGVGSACTAGLLLEWMSPRLRGWWCPLVLLVFVRVWCLGLQRDFYQFTSRCHDGGGHAFRDLVDDVLFHRVADGRYVGFMLG